MNAETLHTITDELVTAGWLDLDPRETDQTAPIVNALQRHHVRANDRAVTAVRLALHTRTPAQEPAAPAVDDEGLPVPTTEELAEEAAFMVDLFYLGKWDRLNGAWAVDTTDVDCSAAPSDLRRSCFRAGRFVAANHGMPTAGPTTKQVVRALIRRMAKDGRLKPS
ncbi:hypothetical protein ACIRP3_36740 [Streptomyces sp. NPDC101209]|uniref:hypothetical protein n=1 Tax=Streptomyces sp. NPDC101209 TaxID=3366129 RepID=UPI0037F73138